MGGDRVVVMRVEGERVEGVHLIGAGWRGDRWRWDFGNAGEKVDLICWRGSKKVSCW